MALAVTATAVALTGSADGRSNRASAAQTELAGQLSSILDDSRLDGSQYALTVRNADTGATLYNANGSQRLLPASNAKIYTSAAAMDVLGPRFRFRTSVLRTGPVHKHVLDGDLVLKGYGDPLATAADYDRLAARVAKSGVHEIDGSLVADDSYFDSVPLAPFWSWDDEPYYYSAQTSALNIAPDDIGDTGTVLVDVYPATTAGRAPKVVMIPANHYLKIHNTATTGSAASAQTVNATREHGRNIIDVTGSIPRGAAGYASQPTVDRPTGLVAEVFRRALARHGVVVHRLREGAAPAGATTVATRTSVPLSQILTPFLKLSNNMIAEALTKAMGAKTTGQGTWAAGTKAILDDAARNGLDTAQLQLFDGSGLGRADYLTSVQTTKLLVALRTKPWFRTWYDALPIAGNPDPLVGGTLRNRMGGTAAANNLHGKTGSETGISALSGYVTDAAGDHLVFSMMSNNFVLGGITTLEDAVGVTLANYGGASASSTVRINPAAAHPASPRSQLECSWTRRC